MLQSQAAKEALVALQIKFKSRYVIEQYTRGGVANFPRAKEFEVCSVARAVQYGQPCAKVIADRVEPALC